MILVDIKCIDCKNIYEVSKGSILDDFISGNCPKCGSKNTKRIWSVGGVDIAQGNLGNAKSGYGKEFTYHPSKYGKYRGQKIR